MARLKKIYDRITLLLVTHDIEEALVFGDRVIVLTGYPGRIAEDFVIPLPRPRCRTATAFQDWKRMILASLDLSLLEDGGQAQGAPVSELRFPSHSQVIPKAEKV